MNVSKPGMIKQVSLMLAGIVMLCSSGCAVFMAVKQPDYKDLTVLNAGNQRASVVSELGSPLITGKRDGRTVDVFAFRQGYSKGNKVSRAMFHGVADAFSLGLWEVIGTPAEAIANGKEMKVEVYYDQDDRVDHVNYLRTK